MKKRAVWLTLSVILVLALLTLSCATTPAPAPSPAPAPAPSAAPRVLKALTSLPDFPAYAIMHYYADAVKIYSGGKLTIDIIGGSEVIPGEEQPAALAKGTVDLIFMAGHALGTLHPIGDAMTMYQLTSWDERDYGLIDFYNQCLHKVNVHFIGQTFAPQWWVLATNIRATSPKDLAGKLIRCEGEGMIGGVKALGAVPVDLPMPDIYTGMERGIIDGFLFPPSGWTDWGWATVTKYVVGPRFMISSGYGPTINLDVWESLSAQEQNWLVQPFIDNARVWWGYSYWIHTGDIFGEEKMKAVGVEFIPWSAEDSAKVEKAFRDSAWQQVKSHLDPADAKEFLRLSKLPYS